MSEIDLYLPQPKETLRGRFQPIFRRLSYDLWRRELKAAGIASKDHPVLVDVGCGPGFLLSCLERWFPNARVVGIDASEKLLDIARSKCRNIRTIKGDACALGLEYESVDAIFALHIVEHLPTPSLFFTEAMRVLRPGGLLIFATPNPRGAGARAMKDRWMGFSDPTHISLKEPAYWRSTAEHVGFRIRKDGTTGLTGIPALNRMPFGLIHWIPTFFFGSFPWALGEAYICRAVKAMHKD